MRPITGMDTDPPLSCLGAMVFAGTLPSVPSITEGSNRALRPPSEGFIESGSFTTSSARARLGSLRMNPRSSSAVINR